MRKRLCLFSVLIVCFFTMRIPESVGQGVSVKAFTDTAFIRIGEQFNLNLELTAPAQYKIQFPHSSDSLGAFEIVAKSRIDTVDNKNNTFTYKQQIQLTRFDSGFYVIPPIPFYYKDLKSSAFDSVQSEALLLTVNTIPVDTTLAIKDIKPPVELPITFRELLPYLLLAAGLALIGYLVYRFLKSRKKIPEILKPKAPLIPPHETALKALKVLAEEKLWQQGMFKQYHTRVTDIVRTYIENRFSILAMEQTTDEILHELKGNLVNDEARGKLDRLLRFADLVKFAKALPVATENETAFAFANDFVLLTKPVTPDDLKEKEVEK